jgi:glycogen debranching enzyme
MDQNYRRRLIRLHPREESFEVSQSRTVLSTDLNGFIREDTVDGLYVHQTRMLSLYQWLVDGRQPMPVALSNVEQHSWMGYYIQQPPGLRSSEQDRGSGEMEEVSEQSLEIRLSRYVGWGVHEDVDVINWTETATSFHLELEVDADFADQEETVRGRQQHGHLTRDWHENAEGNWELSFDYKAKHHYRHQGNAGEAEIHRGITLVFENAGSAPTRRGRKISFEVKLKPRAQWHTCIKMVPHVEGEPMVPVYGCYAFENSDNEFDRRSRSFLDAATQFSTRESSTLAAVVVESLEQSKHDLAALRLHDLDHGNAWTMAAGIPIFLALFGRDTLTASWESQLISTQMMQGTLAELVRWQGTEDNPWRDEEPGKMLHEAHTGPLAMLGFNPRKRYYGAATTSGFYPVVVAELWHWTGNKELVAPFIEPALKALQWKDSRGDLDGDGFYEYLSQSLQGTKNQGWKDSGDAIVYEDGAEVEPPIATCEEQAFVYAAKLELSEVLWWLDRKEEARRLYHQAEELKKRFNQAFWNEDDGFIAMGLDSQKRQIRSAGSNPGHCIATAIVEHGLAKRVADRLMAEDLFSGWGVRTLSAAHPAFNPFSYHRGSVWPVEHGTFALGFMRYGMHDYLERLCGGMFGVAALFDFHRLPEVFSGHHRDERHPFPAMYPKTNWPQAWSCSSVFAMVQAMLGLYPYAPLKILLLDPHLPPWLPELTLRNLHVGQAVVAIRFYRERDGSTNYHVLDLKGHLHILRQPSPWSLTANFAERLTDALSSLIPGK